MSTKPSVLALPDMVYQESGQRRQQRLLMGTLYDGVTENVRLCPLWQKLATFIPFLIQWQHQANLSGLERGAQPLPLWLRNNLTIWHKVWGVRNSVSSLKMFNVQSVTSLKYEDLCKLEVDTLIGLLIKQDPKLRHKWHMPSWIKTNLVQFQSSSC